MYATGNWVYSFQAVKMSSYSSFAIYYVLHCLLNLNNVRCLPNHNELQGNEKLENIYKHQIICTYAFSLHSLMPFCNNLSANTKHQVLPIPNLRIKDKNSVYYNL